MASISNMAATARLLTADQEMYDSATKVTQVFSGIFFSGLAVWLSFTNGTKLSFIQQAALEKRLSVCCFLGVYVGAFSAFFNFFQLTEVDDMALKREENFTLDLARPIEWILTCPLMQLSLVLMGGSKIPEYRRLLMPGLSVLVLACGTTSMLVEDIFVYVAYFCGVIVASCMFYLNRLQIIEHSGGEECFMYGDSEFRKASILLILTWVPFPTFYALSPEGFGVINNILIIQVGWAFLNIVSKFTFIFYIQRIKDNYCSRLKVKREFYSAQNSVMPVKGADGSVTPPLTSAAQKQVEKSQGELGAIVVETMNFLGMAQNSDRFLRLLHHCGVSSVAELSSLSKEQCDKDQLPWDLVAAVQKRLRVWKLEMQDMAELALEQGERHYNMDLEEGVKMQAVSDKLAAHQASLSGTATPVPMGQMILPGAPSGETEQLFNNVSSQGTRLGRVEDMLVAMQQQNERFQADVMRQLQESSMQGAAGMTRAVETSVQQAIQSMQRDREREVEGGMKQRMEELIMATQLRLEQVADGVANNLRQQAREFQATIDRTREAEGSFVNDMEDRLRKAIDELNKGMDASKRSLIDISKEIRANVDSSNNGVARRQEESDRNVARKLEELAQKLQDRSDRAGEHMRSSIQADMTTMISRTDMVSEVVKENAHTMKDNIADLRRISMTILETANNSQESVNQNSTRIMEIRGALDAALDRLQHSVSDLRDRAQFSGDHQQQFQAPSVAGSFAGDVGRDPSRSPMPGTAGTRRSVFSGGASQSSRLGNLGA